MWGSEIRDTSPESESILITPTLSMSRLLVTPLVDTPIAVCFVLPTEGTLGKKYYTSAMMPALLIFL
jgi:hypothetical protein